MNKYNPNSNRVTASAIVERAMEIADITNTDFISYGEKVKYLNDSWKNVYQTIIQYNLNIFTKEIRLDGANGTYKLPFDLYAIKSVKNPYSGAEIPRKSDSDGEYGYHYEIVNDTIVIGPIGGPVSITYWQKPYFLSIPNKTIDTDVDFNTPIIDVCNDSILTKNELNTLVIKNLITGSVLETKEQYDLNSKYYLGKSFLLKKNNAGIAAIDFSGNVIFTKAELVDYIIKSDTGMLYFGIIDNDKVLIYIPGTDNYIADCAYNEKLNNVVCIDNDFFCAPVDAYPIGIFDDRHTYITKNRKLVLVDQDGKRITESVSIPAIGNVTPLRYGFLAFDGTLYSAIPDTELNFPNNIYYDVLSYDLAIRFLCKMNADSSGVENLNTNAWNQLTATIDNSADYAVLKDVR